MHFAIRYDVCERTHVHKIITALLMWTTKDMVQGLAPGWLQRSKPPGSTR